MTTTILTPTQISTNAQPIDRVIQLTGDSPYKGSYYCGTECDGYLRLTNDKTKAKKMCKSIAEGVLSNLRHNAQYCYGSQFTIISIL